MGDELLVELEGWDADDLDLEEGDIIFILDDSDDEEDDTE